MSNAFNYQDLIQIFESTFLSDFNTQLVCGTDEPIYLPADNDVSYHRIIFAHGFYSSALHEVAHWLVAGEKRRLLEDYGYWYEPDGRSAAQQTEFEKVEIVPQAIEWAVALSCGFKFDVSADNLSGIEIDRLAFKHKVYQQVLSYLDNGFSLRTTQLINACGAFYKTAPLTKSMFDYVGME
ncbi:elongation factor P hydroxylase [Psychromonas sp. Urea-02u-13]|uniref:elongation factor P hydroxylase n=1 Tax=Psychromonas sp. Urea-02u-13 TaxID=2058326 RepID=UPI000C3315CD|nr:elongation factor P hydroxylase [Psychromonas sp. Urea-02u-13]PKG40289.1 elongation factor P hydroxylase [Psychromonas sp. Urea-02u-13]